MAAAISELVESFRPLRREEYATLVDAGVFEDERVELLYGVVSEMTPTGPIHDSTIQRLTWLLVRAVGEAAWVRVQSGFAASDQSQPEPDLAIVPREEFDADHPGAAFLIIEVAKSSLKRDRGLKARLYAESGVAEYWVVDLENRLVEVHCDIVGDAYSKVTPFRRGDRITLQQLPNVTLSVDDFLR